MYKSVLRVAQRTGAVSYVIIGGLYAGIGSMSLLLFCDRDKTHTQLKHDAFELRVWRNSKSCLYLNLNLRRLDLVEMPGTAVVLVPNPRIWL